MEKKLRRTFYDMVAATVLCSLVVIVMASLRPSLMQTAGATLSVIGFTCLATMVHRNRAPETNDLAAIEYHRALLQRRLAFCRTRVWLRILAVTPGPLLFSIGFALAHPELAPIMYIQIATFILAVIAIVPLNRRAIAKLQRELGELAGLSENR